MSPKKPTQKSAKSTNKNEGFTAEEKAAMKARARELKAQEDGESAVRASIAAMSPQDRAMAKRLHELIKAAAPNLSPKTWYGMPAYARDGNVVCFFRNAGKFKETVRNVRLQRDREARRRLDVAGRLRAEEVDPGRREEDRRAREESGEVRSGVALSSAEPSGSEKARSRRAFSIDARQRVWA